MPECASTKSLHLRCHGVTMMQATKSSEIESFFRSPGPLLLCALPAVLAQPQMGSVFVVVANVFTHESFQMPFIDTIT